MLKNFLNRNELSCQLSHEAKRLPIVLSAGDTTEMLNLTIKSVRTRNNTYIIQESFLHFVCWTLSSFFFVFVISFSIDLSLQHARG